MKKFIIGVFLAGALLFTGPGLVTTAYAADPTAAAKKAACQGISDEAGGSCGQGGNNISNVVKALLNILSVIAGIAAVIMVVVSGFKFITSGGDAQSVAGAKKTLVYALVGLVVVAMAQFIVHFVLNSLTKK